MSKRNESQSAASVSGVLLKLDQFIRAGGDSGFWPGVCPLVHQCPHVPKRSWPPAGPVVTALVAVAFFVAGVAVEVGGFLLSPRLTDGQPGGGAVARDQFSGAAAGGIGLDDQDLRGALMDRMSPDRIPVGLQRWTFRKGLVWVLDFMVPWSETTYSEFVDGPGSNITNDLVEAIVACSRELVENPGGGRVGVVDTVTVAGWEWAIRHSSTGACGTDSLGLWVGEVIPCRDQRKPKKGSEPDRP